MAEDRKRSTATYKGRAVIVDADKHARGWRWSYIIDGATTGASTRTDLLSADAALKQGMAAAESRVDELQRP